MLRRKHQKYLTANDRPSQTKLNIYFTQMESYFCYRRTQWKQNSWGTFYTNVALIATAFEFRILYICSSAYSQPNGRLTDFIRYYFISQH